MNGRAWSPHELATARRMAKAGYNAREIGAHLERNPDVVGRKLRAEGIASGHNPALGAMMARISLRRLLRRGRMAA